ncbi:unnamed protein product [Urochloa humidicola]
MLLLLARQLGCRELRTDGGSFRRQDAIILLLFVSDAALLASRVARTAAPSASALVMVASGATALGLGGCCSYLLHRRSCSKQHRQQMILPLVLESRS